MVTLRHWPVCNRTPSVPALDLSCTAPAAPSVPCASHSHHLSVTALSLRHLSCADNHVQFLNSFHVMFCDYCFRLSYTWKVPKSSNWMPTGHMPRKQWRTSGFFLAHHDMVESWLMDLLKFMNLKSLEAVCEGEERPSALTRAWHTGVVQISLINDVGGGSIAYFYIGKCTADPSRSPPLKRSPLSKKGDLRLSWWKFHRCCF